MEIFNEITALAALSVVAFQQILKLDVIPVYIANKFPLATNILLSFTAAIIVQWQTALTLTTPVDWVVYVAMISVVAAITYNMTLKNSDGVQRLSRYDGRH